jgi:hypothetical protein
VKRAQALLAMVFAGYHGDASTWTRLYVEHRISLTVAREHYRKGIAAKDRGIPCNCTDCKPKEKSA